MLKQFPDWRLSSGHAHPDANSFIIFARGQYLTGDSGYAGVPMTEHHNTLLIDGKGQGKEGEGHDAFSEMSYEQLNDIRIVDFKVDRDKVTVRGDATAAYLPELGLKKFVREFAYQPDAGFTVADDIETIRPAVLTWVLHADDRIEKGEGCVFTITAGRVKLLDDVTLAAPVEQTQQSIESKIETNNLTAPGPPGAVDKGERQARGQKLLLSTAVSTTKARFVQRLTVSSK
jgi:hypothetical protein